MSFSKKIWQKHNFFFQKKIVFWLGWAYVLLKRLQHSLKKCYFLLRSFEKNTKFLNSFTFFFKKMKHSLRSLMFFTKKTQHSLRSFGFHKLQKLNKKNTNELCVLFKERKKVRCQTLQDTLAVLFYSCYNIVALIYSYIWDKMYNNDVIWQIVAYSTMT